MNEAIHLPLGIHFLLAAQSEFIHAFIHAFIHDNIQRQAQSHLVVYCILAY